MSHERMEKECFGLPHGGSTFWLIIGILIILWGISSLLKEFYGIDIPWWPLVVLMFGVLVVAGAIYRLLRKR